MSFLANLEWRRAVKHFGSNHESVDIDPIVHAMTQAPSSFGL
jgi:nitroreductase/dihydropteridine reductase